MAKKFDLFVDPAETGKAQMGSRSGSILFNGMVDQEYCLLTDKRLYYKGISYGTGNLGAKAKSEIVIDLASITSTGFCIIKKVGLLLMSILFLLLGVGSLFLRESMGENAMYLCYVGVGLFALFLLLYFLVRKRLMQIVYCGGSLLLQCWGQPEKNMRAFCSAIHAASDALKEKVPEMQIYEPVPIFPVAEPVIAPVEPVAETPAEV